MPAILCGSTACLLGIALASAQAQERGLAPQELIAELLRSNPQIKGARFRYDGATKRPSQLGTPPDPTVSLSNIGVGHPVSGLNGSEFAYVGFGVSQELPFPGKLAFAADEARREAESERENYRALILDVTSRLKVAYYDWLGAMKAIEVTRM